jgi:hypothetical protein
MKRVLKILSITALGTMTFQGAAQAGSEVCYTIIIAPAIGATTTGYFLAQTTSKNKKETAYLYLKENNKELRKALAVGDGEPIQDLLKMYSVPKAKAASAIAVLSSNRKEILSLSNPQTLSTQKANATFNFIGSIFEKNGLIAKSRHS